MGAGVGEPLEDVAFGALVVLSSACGASGTPLSTPSQHTAARRLDKAFLCPGKSAPLLNLSPTAPGQRSRSQVFMPNLGVQLTTPLPCLSETLLEAPWPPPQPLFS